MSEPARDAEGIFFTALDKATPQERAAFVEEACAGRPDLLQRVRELLASHQQSHGPLDAPPQYLGATVEQSPLPERPGTSIGPYKLLQQIGEGGMGVVFMAEQQEPVRRKVALKIIKPGMDSGQVIARFEAERQALAMMEHQNIARVLDAGTTDNSAAMADGDWQADRTAVAASKLGLGRGPERRWQDSSDRQFRQDGAALGNGDRQTDRTAAATSRPGHCCGPERRRQDSSDW